MAETVAETETETETETVADHEHRGDALESRRMRSIAIITLVSLALTACSSGPEPSSPRQVAEPVPPSPPATLHGDVSAFRSVLRLAGAIDETNHWSGGALVVVQTGDVLDRGDDETALRGGC